MATETSYFPLAGGAQDGWSNETEATATCFCGAVQLAFVSLWSKSTSYRLPSNIQAPPPPPQPLQAPGLINTFACHCSDCHKITASQFSSNFTVDDKYLRHLRGRDGLTVYAQSRTIATGNTVSNYFCAACGTLMYRVSSALPHVAVLRSGTVDDFRLQETTLAPQVEHSTRDRLAWVPEVKGVAERHEAGHPSATFFTEPYKRP